MIPDDLHPALRGMLLILPPAGARWPLEQQTRWLDAMAAIFDLIYDAPREGVDTPRVVRDLRRLAGG